MRPTPFRFCTVQCLLSAMLLILLNNTASAKPVWPLIRDNDRDGYNDVQGDCDDNNAAIHPGAAEVCGDGIDQDCDGTDTPCCTLDQDHDGWCGETGASPFDCDDTNPAVFPGATEVCDQHDNDCDGVVDEGVMSAFYQDGDGDGYGSLTSLQACQVPTGYVPQGGDCNDRDSTIYPGAPELCDGLDNDCDTTVDEGASHQMVYVDADGDGYGTGDPFEVCGLVPGVTTVNGDCNDSNATIFPGAPETCDAIDNDCDGQVDEGLVRTYYADADKDGFGNKAVTTSACAQPAGYVTTSGDCNDTNASVYPGAVELCDSLDNDCDGVTDEGVRFSYYRDADGDGFGAGTPTQACSAPSGYVSNASDCDDTNASVHPGAGDPCDGLDNDCNGIVDDGGTNTYFRDVDGDGFGTTGSTTQSCSAPAGYADIAGDCDDTNANIYPGAVEACDGIDNDCDGQIDESTGTTTYYRDADGDGFGASNSFTQACARPAGYVIQDGDCNDGDPAIYPGAGEACDGVDNDCDGSIDEGAVLVTYYLDHDGDGFGSGTALQACDVPAGAATAGGDCNDYNASIHPGAVEACDEVDNDCDKLVDEGFDRDGDGASACGSDCDDSDPDIHPGAQEVCDGVDNDCDGAVDEGLVETLYPDEDLDGWGDENAGVEFCDPPVGYEDYISVGGDCDDAMWSVNPDGTELCNGMDDDCDGLVDATDVFDITTGQLSDMGSACDTFDRVVGADIDLLKIYYTFGGQSGTMTYRDSILVAGHTPGVNTPRGWPSGCVYFDNGVYWYSQSNPSYTYVAALGLSKGTDDTGQDEVYLQVTYMGITAGGAFNNEPDGDGLDDVYFSEEESTPQYEVWYVSDTAATSGIGYSATMEIQNARIVVDLAP